MLFFILLFLVGGYSLKYREVSYQNSFNSESERNEFSSNQYAIFEAGNGGTVLKFEVPSKGVESVMKDIDLSPYRGLKVKFSCSSKAQNISTPAQTYNGVKFMLNYESTEEGMKYHNPSNLFGTWDWKEISFTVTIANDANMGKIILGLQDSTGEAWFDDLRITVMSYTPIEPNQPPMYKGHSLERLRGMMSPSILNIVEEDIRFLVEEWNANLIRLQIVRNWGVSGSDRNRTEYKEWIHKQLDHIDTVLTWCKKYGIYANIDLHTPPGGRDTIDGKSSIMVMYYESEYADDFIEIWKEIATRYKDNPVVWSYDILNEPLSGEYNCLDLIERAAKEVRKIDQSTAIIIPGCEWDVPSAFDAGKMYAFEDISNLIYTVHMYNPHSYTHQGVGTYPKDKHYPGSIDGKYWDISALNETLAQVKQFSLYYNLHVYVGEFSVTRWSSGGGDYLKDVLQVMEDYDFDYSYHAFREWSGWSLEHSNVESETEKQSNTTTNDRKEAMLYWLAKNELPNFEASNDSSEGNENQFILPIVIVSSIIGAIILVIVSVVIICVVVTLIHLSLSKKKKNNNSIEMDFQ